MAENVIKAAVPEAVAEPAADAVFQVETHGIDVIPDDDRHGRPFELFWLWLASNIIITYIIEGAVLISLGLNFWWSLAAIIVGNGLYVLVGICGLPGPKAGTAALVISRAAFGTRGNILPTALSWITTVGWEAVNFVLGTFALIALAEQIGIPSTTPVKAILLGVTIIATFAVAVLGHATIVYLQKIFTYMMGIVMLALFIAVIPKAHFATHTGTLAASNVFATFVLGVIIIAAAALSYVNIVADYNRYMPRSTPAGPIVGWTVLGSIIPATLVPLIGVMAATATNMTDPIAGLKPLLPHWFFVVFLVVVVIGSLMNNVVGIYSGGLQLLTLGVRLDRWKTIPFDGVLATAASVYAVFFHDFTSTFIQFLSLYIIWLAPWCAIYLVDMWMRRYQYDSAELLRARGGRYWYRNGYNAAALISWAVGAVAAGLTINTTLWQSVVVTRLIGGADLSIPVGLIVAGGLYYFLQRRAVPVRHADTVVARGATNV